MRRRGIAFVFVAAALFAVGDITRTGWVQIADALLWGAIVVSAVLPTLCVWGLRVDPRFVVERTASGDHRGTPDQADAIAVAVEVTNRWPWPRFGVTCAFDVVVNDEVRRRVSLYLPYVGMRGSITVQGRFEHVTRGFHELRAGTIACEAPFGFFGRRVKVEATALQLIHPSPALPDEVFAEDAPLGSAAQPQSARSGEEVSGSRPYGAGDPARAIHWKNTARAGRLMTKSFMSTASEERVLLVSAPPGATDALDDVVRVAAGVGFAWGTRGTPVAIVTGTAVRQVSWPQFADHLARLTPSSLPALEDAIPTLGQDVTLGVVLDAKDDAGVDALAATAHRTAGVRAWLLHASEDDEAQAAVLRLRGAGVAVSLVQLPLPKPEPRR